MYFTLHAEIWLNACINVDVDRCINHYIIPTIHMSFVMRMTTCSTKCLCTCTMYSAKLRLSRNAKARAIRPISTSTRKKNWRFQRPRNAPKNSPIFSFHENFWVLNCLRATCPSPQSLFFVRLMQDILIWSDRIGSRSQCFHGIQYIVHVYTYMYMYIYGIILDWFLSLNWPLYGHLH